MVGYCKACKQCQCKTCLFMEINGKVPGSVFSGMTIFTISEVVCSGQARRLTPIVHH
jgi:hypothetical protein